MKARTEIRTEPVQPGVVTGTRHRRRDAAFGVLVAVFLSGLIWLVVYVAVIR